YKKFKPKIIQKTYWPVVKLYNMPKIRDKWKELKNGMSDFYITTSYNRKKNTALNGCVLLHQKCG
ncbi:MAG TPA: hypothetical protein PLG88_08115, partial [Chitinophagaceae bacterium]|nr:hypothetical protein [Chitinophagaceae bacterium]